MTLRLGVPLVVAVLFLLIVCSEQTKQQREASLRKSMDAFHAGDIAFRRGNGLMSRAVVFAGKDGVYSHVGILNRHADSTWWVIHAVPGEPAYSGDPDRVKCEPLERFFAPDRAVSGAVMQVVADSATCLAAAAHAERLAAAGILFDHDYNLADTTSLYCTELIDFVYREQGVDLPEGRISSISLPGWSGDYLFPDDIARSTKLRTIYFF
jgi:hypothetical protein